MFVYHPNCTLNFVSLLLNETAEQPPHYSQNIYFSLGILNVQEFLVSIPLAFPVLQVSSDSSFMRIVRLRTSVLIPNI
jgi:hypothetical protein